MELLRSAFIIIGFLALILRFLLGLFFAEEMNAKGTTKWKLKNILGIIFGFGFLIVFGLSLVFVSLQENREPYYFQASYLIIFGIGIIWNSINILLGEKTKWIYSLGLFGGILFVISQLLSMWESIQLSETFYPISQDTIALVIGIFIILYFAKAFISFEPEDTDTSKTEPVEPSI